MEAIRRTGGSLQEVSADLDAPLAVVGSYQRNGDRIRITGRVVNVSTGEALADAKVDGLLTEIFELQDRVVVQFSKDLGIATDLIVRSAGSRETPTLEAYRAFTEGWLRIETFDIREIPQAIANFERLSESILDTRSPSPALPARSGRRTKTCGQKMRHRNSCSTLRSATRGGP
jgi:hypothetical protein